MSISSSVAGDGRSVSRARRHALSAGKAALPAAGERVRDGSRGATPRNEPTPREPEIAPPISAISAGGNHSCRDAARARRIAHSRHGRGNAPPMPPTRPPRIGRIVDAPQAVESQPQGRVRVTGGRLAGDRHVTGAERGIALPVSGTQYIGADSGPAWRAGGPKVGRARSEGGVIISGTLVRSKVPVTGDEAGSGVTITGEADGHIEDDVTIRPDQSASSAAQFARQTDPHGQSVHSNIARSARYFGSRVRQRPVASDSTHGGPPVTGDRYSAPAREGAQRGDQMTGMTGFVARTGSGSPVTGIDVEQHPRVTGNELGVCAAVTGSSYQGPRATHGGNVAIGDIEARPAARLPSAVVTGDAPLHDAVVTGTERGAVRDVTGTPYFVQASAQTTPPAASVATMNERFSVSSPQRKEHLRARSANGGGRITGSFAGGQGKVTGNLEFAFRPRLTSTDDPARLRLTGEGRAAGRAITGEAWIEQPNVTGTDGAVAAGRNPSRRDGKPQAFSGARRFKTLARIEEPKHLVTGMFGYSSDSAAKVTLSGGAQG